MKFTTTILPFVLYASLATAKGGKRPKFGGSGGSSDEDDQQQPAEETTDFFSDPTPTETGFFTSETATATDAFDVGEVISSFYPTQGVPTIAASASTALASGLLSVESSWFASPEYTSVDAAISSALPLSLSASVAISGYVYGNIMTADWFTESVPAPLQTAVVEYVSAIESVHYRYADATATVAQTGTAGGSLPTRIAGSGAMQTGAPMKVVAAVGVVGGIFAAIL